jgi:3-oxoacyl-[acyl-carrier protein] reductase
VQTPAAPLKGRRALVLASSQGLGRACAEGFARQGAAVVVNSSSQARCDATAAELASATGSPVSGIAADLFRPDDMDRLYAQAAQALGGPPDILVLNHPGPALSPTAVVDFAELDRHHRLMVASPVRLAMAALPAMRRQRLGRILAISGRGAVEPLPNKAMDNLYRPALMAYCKSLSNEVAADGVTVNVLMPGTYLTDRVQASTASNAALWGISVEEAMRRRLAGIPAGRFGQLEEFGAVAAFLASAAAAYVNGSVIRVDGGQIPGTL